MVHGMAARPAAFLAAAALVVAAACSNTTDSNLETKITRMQAFKCVVPGADVCLGRGDSVPLGQLPPRTEGFQVWAWHPGYNTTAWRLLWNDQVSDPAQFQFGLDSVGQPVSLVGFPDSVKTVGVRAYILGVKPGTTDTIVVYKDSIMWTFP